MYGLKTIAKLREIKNHNSMNKEELISTLLKSEEAPQERNYLEYLRNKSNDELKKRINNARTQTSRLGNVLTNSERKAIKK